MKRFYSLLLVILILLLLLVGFFVLRNKKVIVAKIGEVVITKQDLTYRTAVYKKCYSQKKPVEVLAECINDSLEDAVLQAKYNLQPSINDLQGRSAWIDKNTKDPQTLNCLKSVYGKNYQAYLKNVVRPLLINQKLHSLFAVDPTIHQKERKRISVLMAKVKKNPALLPTLPGYGIFQTPREKKTTIKIKGYNIPLGKNLFIEKVLKRLKPGEMWGDIVEDDYSYKIVRLVKADDKSYTWDGVIIPKRNFNDWFKQYVTKNIPIVIKDDPLKKEVIEQYPQVWWVKLIKDGK